MMATDNPTSGRRHSRTIYRGREKSIKAALLQKLPLTTISQPTTPNFVARYYYFELSRTERCGQGEWRENTHTDTFSIPKKESHELLKVA
jgi:hypothetical protein